MTDMAGVKALHDRHNSHSSRLINVTDLTDEQLAERGLPPNPQGWNCWDNKTREYGDAIFCIGQGCICAPLHGKNELK